MGIQRPAFTVGIEEEYLLVDPSTRDLVEDPPDGIMDEAEAVLGRRVAREFLRVQMEVGTGPHDTVAGAGEELRWLRRTVCGIADGHGFSVIASSTHPFAHWSRQQVTSQQRYLMLAEDLQQVARRLVICGMHVHVGVEDPDLRIDLMNQASYFLPHLLALTTSSPFWHGHRTGLKSYRTSVFRGMPRTGLPPRFQSWGEYRRHVDALVGTGLIEDAGKLWWDLRPSDRYPTLEMRVADVCTVVEHGIAVAALYVSLLGMLFERRLANQRWRTYEDILIAENLWRAQRYGVDQPMADFGKGELVPYPDLLDEMIDLVLPTARGLGCGAEVESAPRILDDGTSADRQVRAYQEAVDAGAEHFEALRAVVDLLIEDTRRGL
jgi:carboxylate-amine ligase